METVVPVEVTEASSADRAFDVEVNVAEYAGCYTYLVGLVVDGVKRDFLIKTDDDLKPRVYEAGGVVYILTGNQLAVWSETNGLRFESFVLIDHAIETKFGVLVVYHLGCAMIDFSGEMAWDYRHDVLIDIRVGEADALLEFEDGSRHAVDLVSGRKMS